MGEIEGQERAGAERMRQCAICERSPAAIVEQDTPMCMACWENWMACRGELKV